MASDASTSVGLAGVLFFGEANDDFPGIDGLFWQLSWDEWNRSFGEDPLSGLSTRINSAEFLAALITCETFANFCANSLTTLQVDNFTSYT